MIERHGNTLKHAQENTQKSEARENVRDHERTRGETIETKQEPEKARVSLFPLLPLFVFSFFISSASRTHEITDHRPTPTQNYTYSIQQRSAIQHRTRHQGTSQATAAAAEHTARSTRHKAQSVQSTEHTPHSAKHTAHSTQHAAHSTQRKAHSTEQTPQNTQQRAHIAQQSTAQSTALSR